MYETLTKHRKPLLDLHTHTVASGHAYSSLQEMVRAAEEKGIQILGITEHGPSIPGTCPLLYFKNMGVIPREINGVKLMMGCEINILNTRGEIDMEEEMMHYLDIRIAGIHSICWQGGSKTDNTDGMIAAMHNPYIQIICHPGDGSADMHFETVVLASKETHTLLKSETLYISIFYKNMVQIWNKYLISK